MDMNDSQLNWLFEKKKKTFKLVLSKYVAAQEENLV